LEEKIGVERERLEGEVLRRLERGQERIGRDLPDGPCQILVGAKYRVGVLETMVANHLYRITQGAVQNAIKHGKARKTSTVLRKLAGRLILRVGD
jgi:signal transduction histidine kinase